MLYFKFQMTELLSQSILMHVLAMWNDGVLHAHVTRVQTKRCLNLYFIYHVRPGCYFL